MSVTIQPLADRVILQPLENDKTTEGGIFLPKAENEKPMQAKVVGVGPEVNQVKIGDLVVYSKYGGMGVNIGEENNFVIVKQEDILAIMKEDE